ncbi:MAG: metallophosphoesterase [Bryobacteraceae bacterium]|jgi:predicted phosphodiesterase
MRRCLALAIAFAGFLLAAEPAQNDFRFSILGDRTGDAQPGVYERVWNEMNALHPDFVINVGDTIQGGNDATAASEWRAISPLWARYRYTIYFTPGNHDIWSAASHAIYEQQTRRPAFYGFNYQKAHFTVLDNSDAPDLSGDLSETQMQFLARDLEQNRDRDPKFVFFHKPFWLIPVKLQSSHFPFHQLIAKYGVRHVVSGHGHQYVHAVEDGVTYLEAPSSGGKLKGQGFAQGWFYGQVLVTVKGSAVSLTVKEIGPPFGQGRSFQPKD